MAQGVVTGGEREEGPDSKPQAEANASRRDLLFNLLQQGLET